MPANKSVSSLAVGGWQGLEFSAVLSKSAFLGGWFIIQPTRVVIQSYFLLKALPDPRKKCLEVSSAAHQEGQIPTQLELPLSPTDGYFQVNGWHFEWLVEASLPPPIQITEFLYYFSWDP